LHGGKRGPQFAHAVVRREDGSLIHVQPVVVRSLPLSQNFKRAGPIRGSFEATMPPSRAPICFESIGEKQATCPTMPTGWLR
jgi:hypothetical protein